MPLPHTTKVYGQLLGRDFNPLDLLLLLRTIWPYWSYWSAIDPCGWVL